MEAKNRQISVVVPVYNAQSTLRPLYEQLVQQLEPHQSAFEIILVEDCGSDGSWAVIRQLAEEDDRVVGLRLSRNYGQHNALLCGIRAAKHDVIVTMDDDLQNPPDQIPILLAELEKGYDVVYGVPDQEQHGLLRDLASKATKAALRIAIGVEVAGQVSAFRAFRSELREAFVDYRSPSVSIDVLLTWGTTNFSSVVVKHEMRSVGRSNYTLLRLINHAFTVLTGFSTFPLKIASYMGFVLTAFGFVVLVWVIGRYLIEGGSVPGFAFIASLIAIFSGAQFFALGIFGEYLARMYLKSMDQPAYVVKEVSVADKMAARAPTEPSEHGPPKLGTEL